MNGARKTHASAVLLGEHAVLIRGAPGSGKTSLALALIEAGDGARFARLIGDDRVALEHRHGRLVARPDPAIAGLVERRGLGLTPIRHEEAGVVALVVDLAAEAAARLPEPEELVATVEGVTLPRLKLSRGAADAGLVRAALALFTTPERSW